jgi:hypothetical protein
MELPWIFGEGLLDVKSVVVCDAEFEVADFAAEARITGETKPFDISRG